MDLVRATAHLPDTTLEVVEAVFAERVTTTAIFCAAHQLTSAEILEVGTRVELEVTAGDHTAAFVCRGVVGWVYADDTAPAGREAGVGILVDKVTDGAERFTRMVARAGAGGRVRLPGARLVQRLRIERPQRPDIGTGTGVVVVAPRSSDDGPPPPAPIAALPRTATSVVKTADDTDSSPTGEVIVPAAAPTVLPTSPAMFTSRPPAPAASVDDDLADIEDALGALDDVAPEAATTVMFLGDDVVLPREAFRPDRHVEVTRIAAMPRPIEDSDPADESAADESAADESAADESAADESAALPPPLVDAPLADLLHEPTLAFADADDFADAEMADVDDINDLNDVGEADAFDGADGLAGAPAGDGPGDGLGAELDEPPVDVAERLKVLTAALQGLAGDDGVGLDGPTLDGESGEGSMATPLPSQPRPSLATGDVDLSALEELPLPPEDDGGLVFPPPGAGEALILDLSDVSAFPEAPELPPGRPFEAQSTDVDLLGSISAGDVVPIDGGSLDAATGSQTIPRPTMLSSSLSSPPSPPLGVAAAAAVVRARAEASARQASTDGLDLDDDDELFQPPPRTGLEDLPSMEADLLDGAEAWPDEGVEARNSWTAVDTELFTNRRLPDHEPFPAWSDLLDARTIGAAFSWTKRGLNGLEFFAWPLAGTKRYSGIGQGESSDPRRTRTAIVAMADFDDSIGDPPAPHDHDDDDVFSAPSLPPEPEDDPFSARTTDPRLNVEGLVARHVRASHLDADTAVFDTPDLSDLDDELAPAPGVEHGLDSLSGFAGLDPDVTRDEHALPPKPLPVARHRPAVPTKVLADPLSGTDSGEGLSSSESDEHR